MEWMSKKIFQYVLGVAIILMGIVAYKTKLVPNPEILLGLFTVYGLWRIYRGYKIQQ
jgi:uncharacterized membrane protein